MESDQNNPKEVIDLTLPLPLGLALGLIKAFPPKLCFHFERGSLFPFERRGSLFYLCLRETLARVRQVVFMMSQMRPQALNI